MHVHGPNYFQQMVCSWMYLLWFSIAFMLEHMHSSPAFITTIMWVAYICTLWKIIPKNHIRIKTWSKSNLKKMDVVFVHSNITFWITNKKNHFMPYFLATTFYIHAKQATSTKNIGRSHTFFKALEICSQAYMLLEWPSIIIFMLTMHSTLHGSKQVGLHTFSCGWNRTWKLYHTHGSKKVGLHPFVCATNQTWKLHQHFMGNKGSD